MVGSAARVPDPGGLSLEGLIEDSLRGQQDLFRAARKLVNAVQNMTPSSNSNELALTISAVLAAAAQQVDLVGFLADRLTS